MEWHAREPLGLCAGSDPTLVQLYRIPALSGECPDCDADEGFILMLSLALSMNWNVIHRELFTSSSSDDYILGSERGMVGEPLLNS
jgi:hypothetical protein